MKFYSLLDKRGKLSLNSGTSFVGAHVDCADQISDEEAEDGCWLHSEGSCLMFGVSCGALRLWMRIDFAFIVVVQ